MAHELSRALTSNSALFVGNSMAIRDVDMYGRNWTTCTRTVADIMLNSEFPHQWIRVAGNRGASGIDGLLSTAIGFAVGCNKHVSILCAYVYSINCVVSYLSHPFHHHISTFPQN